MSIFKKYDIRGKVGPINELDPVIVHNIGRATGQFLKIQGAREIALGYDMRSNYKVIRSEFINGLLKSGIDITDLGMVTTPVVYHATRTTASDAGVMITASHLPSEYNGFKITCRNQPIWGEELKVIERIMNDHQWESVTRTGTIQYSNHWMTYCADMVTRFEGKINKFNSVVIDAGNGMGAKTIVPILESLGVKVFVYNETPDDTFPDHPPDPVVEANMITLREKVLEHGASVGFAFDGDGDRLGVVMNDGEIMPADRLAALLIKSITQKYQKATIIGDVKCSSVLKASVEKFNGSFIESPTGHSIIKTVIQQFNAKMAVEMSGHLYFNDEYFGFDDACYAALRVLEMMSDNDECLSLMNTLLPKTYITPEVRIPYKQYRPYADGQMSEWLLYANDMIGTWEMVTGISRIDGLKVNFEGNNGNGWGLIRLSNTEDAIIFRAEASNEELFENIKSKFRGLLFNTSLI